MTNRSALFALFSAAALAAAPCAVRADAVTVDLNASSGLNYETAVVTPTVSGAPGSATLTLVAKDPVKGTVTETGLRTDQPHAFHSRTAARSVVLDGYVVDGGETLTAAHDLLLMGRAHDDDWVCETAETYAKGTGSAVWSGTNYITVAGGRLAIDTTVDTNSLSLVSCEIGAVPSPRRGYTIFMDVSYPAAFADPPDPTGQRLGLTIAAPGESASAATNFYYVENGAWTKVPSSVCDASAATDWQVHIAVDLTSQAATYYARASSNESWRILGTAAGVGSTSVTEASFCGAGALARMKGNGFDAQLLDVSVEFAESNLVPGVNFEETVVTGRVTATEVHETDRLTGTYAVRLTDLEGNVIETCDFTFTAGGEMEFYVKASELKSGAAYRAEVILGDALTEVAESGGVSAVAVMGRPITNALWGADGLWVSENARTFDGDEPGTGVWSGRAYAATAGGWINVNTVTDEAASGATVAFRPTNAVDEAHASYVAGIRAVFSQPVDTLEDVDAAYGWTVASVDGTGTVSFACLSNRVWQIVPTSVAAPELGEEYALSVYVNEEDRSLTYAVTDSANRQTQLLDVDLEPEFCRLFESVEVQGVGAVTDLTGDLYSTDLLRIHTTFDDDALAPGTNFTASAANGVIRFERLWETDRTNGTLRIVVRDRTGLVVGQRRISFHGLADRDFDYYITGLVPGESYSVSVVAEVKGVDSDSSSASGTMSRLVTNELWKTEGWIREDADTFATNKIGTGRWTADIGMAVAQDGVIEVDTSLLDDMSSRVTFLATNALPHHTGLEFRSRLAFDVACADLPTVEGKYGITLVQSDESVTGYKFAVVTNGVWAAVDPDVYAPLTEVEYEVTVCIEYSTARVRYLVSSETDPTPAAIADFPLAGTDRTVPVRTEFYGIGHVRAHEGDGRDVTVVEFEPVFDETSLQPGTNFASTVASGVLNIRQMWMTDVTSGDFSVVVRDVYGNVVSSQAMTYEALTNHDFRVTVDGLAAGGVYDVDIVADRGSEVASSSHFVATMARELGGWIRETPATFLGEETATGLWSGTNGVTGVIGEGEEREILIESGQDDPTVRFHPTNDTLSVRSAAVREIRLNLDFSHVNWLKTDDPPAVPEGALAAVTVWGDDPDSVANPETALAVLTTNRTWTVLDETRFSRLTGEDCTVSMLVDMKNGYVRYTLAAGTETNHVYRYDFAPEGIWNLDLTLEGYGTLRAVDGDAWDANLIAGGTNEYADLDSAIADNDPATALSPLWWADQLVTLGRGTFKVDDPQNWLTVRFPWWYYVEVSTNGSVRVFRFNQSNNWIDYAAGGDSNVVVNGSVFLVKTPEGLSWIAAQATNEWISGRIELAGDIDLSIHTWTPIAGFTGTFDGRGRTVRGLNNMVRSPGIPGGEYVSGPTNAWGRSAYGLFGTATNATLTGVTFAEVAISNVADSVAALAGVLAGNCAVSNVTVESGSILGAGGTAAGVAGFADFTDFLTFVGNTNRASVTADADFYGDGRWAAGLLCVAGPTDPSATPGAVTVTNNANFGAVSNMLYDVDLLGGNVAQILAGATLGARFGDVHVSNNLAAGSVAAELVRSADNEIVATNFPAVNLASAFWGYGADGTFYRHLEANRAGVVPVDPVNRTARMLSGTFPNGTVNAGGLVNDEISALLPGSTVTLTEGFDSWGPIVLDRDLTVDMNGQMIYTIYVNNTFVLSNGVEATVSNGTIVVGPESLPFAGDTTNLHTNDHLVVQSVDEDFYERTQVAVNGEPISALYSSYVTEVMNRSGSVIELYGEDVELDVDAGVLKVNGKTIARLSECYGFKAAEGEGGVLTFEVKILDSAAPTAEFSMTGGSGGTVSVTVGNAKEGFWYALQHRGSLAEEWNTPSAEEWVQADRGGASITAPKGGAQGFYRVIMSDIPGGVSAE